MAGRNRGRVGAGWCVAGLLIVLVAGCGESPGLARRKTTRRPVPPRGGDPSARIAALIRELDQIEAHEYGMIGGEDPKKDPIVVDLIAEGEPAVEPLLAALATDDRLTKTRLSNHYWKAGGFLPVSHLVHHALKRLMQTNRFSQAVQFSKQGDEAELKTPEGRKRVAGLAREFWRKNRGVPLGERFYRYLADDDAAPLRWVEAAAGLVAPADDEGVPDVTYVNLGRPTRAAPGQPRHGDEVKDRVPTVSDLLAQRAAELAGNGPARTIPDQGLILRERSSGFCSCRGTSGRHCRRSSVSGRRTSNARRTRGKRPRTVSFPNTSICSRPSSPARASSSGRVARQEGSRPAAPGGGPEAAAGRGTWRRRPRGGRRGAGPLVGSEVEHDQRAQRPEPPGPGGNDASIRHLGNRRDDRLPGNRRERVRQYPAPQPADRPAGAGYDRGGCQLWLGRQGRHALGHGPRGNAHGAG